MLQLLFADPSDHIQCNLDAGILSKRKGVVSRHPSPTLSKQPLPSESIGEDSQRRFRKECSS